MLTLVETKVGRPRIMLDLDGTVYHWERTARYLLRKWYTEQGKVIIDERASVAKPYPAALDNPSTYYDYIEHNVSAEAWEWLWTDGVARGMFREGHIYTGAGEAIHELAKLGDVIVVTKRPASAINDTLDWLSFRRWAISGLHFLHGADEHKSEIQPGFDIAIDDSPHVVQDLFSNTNAGIVLVDRAWNQNVPEDTDLMRAFSWEDVLDKVAKMLRERGWNV